MSAMAPDVRAKRPGEPLGSATKKRSGTTQDMATAGITTPTSENCHIPSNVPSTNSPFTLASPNNAQPPTYVDTICEIVKRWPGLDKQTIIDEGIEWGKTRYPEKTAEKIKAGFQNVFSTQKAKNGKNPRIQGWDFNQIDAEGMVILDKSTCRWLLADVDPKGVQLWEAPSVPLAHDNRDQATARGTQHSNSSPQARRAPEADSGAPVRDGTQRIHGLPEGVGYHTSLQGTTSCADTNNQDTTLPQIEGGEMTGDQSTSAQDPSAEMNAYDEWSERAQGDYWGFQVRRKKSMLHKLRAEEASLTELSSQSAQLKQFEDEDTSQLNELEVKMQALRERIRQRAMEAEQVHQNESLASKAASDLRGELDKINKRLDEYWAEED